MGIRVNALGLIALSALSIATAAAQISSGPSGKPDAAAAIPDSESRDSISALLIKGGTLSYSLVNLDVHIKSVVTLHHVKDDEYVRSDGTEFKGLTDLVSDARFSYSPPIPLVRLPLTAGQKWQYAGKVSERSALASASISSNFEVLGKASIATPAGEFEVVEIVERREFSGNAFTVHRYVEERHGVILKEAWKTNRIHPYQGGGGLGGSPRPDRINTDMTLDRLPGKPDALVATADFDRDSISGLLIRGGTLGYSLVNLDSNTKSVVTLRHVKDDEYVRSDGTKLKGLTDLVHDATYGYSPPVPLVQLPLSAGQKWKYSGTISERFGIASSPIHCDFVVLGKTTIATPAGNLEAIEILETREFSSFGFTIHRYVDEKQGVVLKEKWETLRTSNAVLIGWTSLRGGRVHTEMTLNRLPSE